MKRILFCILCAFLSSIFLYGFGVREKKASDSERLIFSPPSTTSNDVSVSSKGDLFLDGGIAVVGNEPFSKLVIRTETGEYEIPGIWKEQLIGLQNSSVRIYVKELPLRKTDSYELIVLESIISWQKL